MPNTTKTAVLIYSTQEDMKIYKIDNPTIEDLEVLTKISGKVINVGEFTEEELLDSNKVVAATMNYPNDVPSGIPSEWISRYVDSEVTTLEPLSVEGSCQIFNLTFFM